MTVQPEKNYAVPKLTIGILTLNEEKRIATCINSAIFADQIIVVDSGSKDRTKEIAASLGAEVYYLNAYSSISAWRGRARRVVARHGAACACGHARGKFSPRVRTHARSTGKQGRVLRFFDTNFQIDYD